MSGADGSVPNLASTTQDDDKLLQNLLFDTDLIQLGTVVESGAQGGNNDLGSWGNGASDPLGGDAVLNSALQTNDVTLSALNQQQTPLQTVRMPPNTGSGVSSAPAIHVGTAPMSQSSVDLLTPSAAMAPVMKQEPPSPSMSAISSDAHGAGSSVYRDAPPSPQMDYSNMSAEEIKLAKRARRLRKNRESAQASRLRKRKYVEDLERQVHSLAGERNGLTSQVEDLVVRNKALSDEVEHLKTVIKNSNHLASYYAMSST